MPGVGQRLGWHVSLAIVGTIIDRVVLLRREKPRGGEQPQTDWRCIGGILLCVVGLMVMGGAELYRRVADRVTKTSTCPGCGRKTITQSCYLSENSDRQDIGVARSSRAESVMAATAAVFLLAAGVSLVVTLTNAGKGIAVGLIVLILGSVMVYVAVEAWRSTSALKGQPVTLQHECRSCGHNWTQGKTA